MNERQNKKTVKYIILVLSVLLLLSSLTLAGITVYKHSVAGAPSSAVVPDNIITPEKETSAEVAQYITQLAHEKLPAVNSPCIVSLSAQPGVLNSSRAVRLSAQRSSSASTTELYLYKRNSGDNTRFNVDNMFPGDAQTQYYRVRVSYQNKVTVRFHADIHPGYEKLAEVLKCRVVLLTTGEVMYDGLMRDMPASLNHTLRSSEKTTDELLYEITAYLDTSVGNEYMNKSLVADFRWWVEETKNLTDNPKTGDSFNPLLWGDIAFGSLFLLILLLAKRKKEDTQDEQ